MALLGFVHLPDARVRRDETVCLGDGNKGRRKYQTTLGVIETQQRLDADKAAIAEGDLWLEVGEETMVLDAGADFFGREEIGCAPTQS